MLLNAPKPSNWKHNESNLNNFPIINTLSSSTKVENALKTTLLNSKISDAMKPDVFLSVIRHGKTTSRTSDNEWIINLPSLIGKDPPKWEKVPLHPDEYDIEKSTLYAEARKIKKMWFTKVNIYAAYDTVRNIESIELLKKYLAFMGVELVEILQHFELLSARKKWELSEVNGLLASWKVTEQQLQQRGFGSKHILWKEKVIEIPGLQEKIVEESYMQTMQNASDGIEQVIKTILKEWDQDLHVLHLVVAYRTTVQAVEVKNSLERENEGIDVHYDSGHSQLHTYPISKNWQFIERLREESAMKFVRIPMGEYENILSSLGPIINWLSSQNTIAENELVLNEFLVQLESFLKISLDQWNTDVVYFYLQQHKIIQSMILSRILLSTLPWVWSGVAIQKEGILRKFIDSEVLKLWPEWLERLTKLILGAKPWRSTLRYFIYVVSQSKHGEEVLSRIEYNKEITDIVEDIKSIKDKERISKITTLHGVFDINDVYVGTNISYVLPWTIVPIDIKDEVLLDEFLQDTLESKNREVFQRELIIRWWAGSGKTTLFKKYYHDLLLRWENLYLDGTEWDNYFPIFLDWSKLKNTSTRNTYLEHTLSLMKMRSSDIKKVICFIPNSPIEYYVKERDTLILNDISASFWSQTKICIGTDMVYNSVDGTIAWYENNFHEKLLKDYLWEKYSGVYKERFDLLLKNQDIIQRPSDLEQFCSFCLSRDWYLINEKNLTREKLAQYVISWHYKNSSETIDENENKYLSAKYDGLRDIALNTLAISSSSSYEEHIGLIKYIWEIVLNNPSYWADFWINNEIVKEINVQHLSDQKRRGKSFNRGKLDFLEVGRHAFIDNVIDELIFFVKSMVKYWLIEIWESIDWWGDAPLWISNNLLQKYYMHKYLVNNPDTFFTDYPTFNESFRKYTVNIVSASCFELQKEDLLNVIDKIKEYEEETSNNKTLINYFYYAVGVVIKQDYRTSVENMLSDELSIKKIHSATLFVQDNEMLYSRIEERSTVEDAWRSLLKEDRFPNEKNSNPKINNAYGTSKKAPYSMKFNWENNWDEMTRKGDTAWFEEDDLDLTLSEVITNNFEDAKKIRFWLSDGSVIDCRYSLDEHKNRFCSISGEYGKKKVNFYFQILPSEFWNDYRSIEGPHENEYKLEMILN